MKTYSDFYQQCIKEHTSLNERSGLYDFKYAVQNPHEDGFLKLSKELKFKAIFPDIKFCGDNAAMIAWTGIQRFKKNLFNKIDIPAKSRWPLDSKAPYMKGPGLKL